MFVAATPRRIVAFGSQWRGDDGVGLAILEALRQVGVAGEHHLAPDPLLFDGGPMVLLDAICGGGQPGNIYQLTANELLACGQSFATTVSHGFDLLTALKLAATLGSNLDEVLIVGVEPASFEIGAPLSPPVAAAVPKVVARIIERQLF